MRRKTSDFQRMQKDWGVLQYGTEAVDAARVERINRKFDDILIYLADGILPEWQKIDCLETYFAKERHEVLPRPGQKDRETDNRGAGMKEAKITAVLPTERRRNYGVTGNHSFKVIGYYICEIIHTPNGCRASAGILCLSAGA